MTGAIDKGFSDDLDEKLTGFLRGSKIWDDIDGAIHVNDMLREVAKVIPGFFDEHYAMLSEFAHRNWSGTFGSFGIIIEKELMVEFARGGRAPETQHVLIAGRLAGSFGLLIGYYNKLADLLPGFLQSVALFHATKAKRK